MSMRILVSANRLLAPLALAALVFAGIAAAQVPQSLTHDTPSGRVPERPQPTYSAKPVTAGALAPRGIDAGALAAEGMAGTTLPNWNGVFTDNGGVYSYTMLGTNPAFGSQTTTISTVLIPLKVVFSDGTVLDATAPAFGETESPLQLTKQSPLFQPVSFKPGGTHVGTTQYIDAFQRANFWNIVSTSAPNYHLKFHVTATEPVQTLTVPSYFGFTEVGPKDRLGYIDYSWWDGQLGVLLYRLKIKANTLPIFINYNIFQTSSDFTYAGYHTAFGNPAQVYISAGFYEEGLFTYGGDIVFLSHEMGETADDPFVNNIVPPWNNPQSPGTCSDLLEVGDPVSDLGIGVFVLNGYAYHPEDLTFLPWFSGEIPSVSVNGWYTFGNNYSTPATCSF
jgi:hypothetical protein